MKLPIVALLLWSFALDGCVRGERPAPRSLDNGPPASSQPASSQPSSKPRQGLAAASGFDSLVKQERTGSTCFAGARYVVVERDLDDQVGADLYVRPRGAPDAAPRCNADSIGGDIVFRTGEAASRHPDAQHFMGLKGDLLVAWDGTGALSDLYIYDLKKRAKVFVIESVDENLEWLSPMTVGVWVVKGDTKAAVAAGCPDTIPGNPAELDSLMSLDLEKLILRQTGRYRCTVGQ